MGDFGVELRRLRGEAGLRQQDLVDELDDLVARSTLSNIEHGRQRPTQALMDAVAARRPDWLLTLQPIFDELAADRPPEGSWPVSGPFVLESAMYAYNFRDHRAPEEIIQLRRVRALADVDRYTLMQATEGDRFDMESEALWGGRLTRRSQTVAAGRVANVEQLEFPAVLRKGEVHEFSVRTWVNRVDFDSSILMVISLPTRHTCLRLNFFGGFRPGRLWSYGPLQDTIFVPRDPAEGRPVTRETERSVELEVHRPMQDRFYGIAWD